MRSLCRGGGDKPEDSAWVMSGGRACHACISVLALQVRAICTARSLYLIYPCMYRGPRYFMAAMLVACQPLSG